MQDIIIRGGMIADGTGGRLFRGDVAVCDGKITRIGDLTGEQAKETLDASGLIVAPGFIDSHAHSDTCFARDGSCASKLYQGVTTEISGQCGLSPFPALADRLDREEAWQAESFDAFVRRFEKSGLGMAVNQAMLVGHGQLRAGVMGCEDRAPSDEELSEMKRLLRRDLDAGAWGMSLGLEYSPGFFAGADELGALGEVVAGYGGLIPCHMRSEGLMIDEAIDELITVGRASGAHVHISHLKVDNFRVHGRAGEIWQKIEAAQRAGVNLTADMYPFVASSTTLTIRCPKWSQDGGGQAVVDFLKGPRRQDVIEGIRSHYFSRERAKTCLFSDDAGFWPQIVGKTLDQVAEELLGTDDYAEAAAEVLIRTQGKASCIFFVMSEEDMLYFLAQDVGIGSDGYSLPGDPQKVGFRPHPRSYAAIAEFFRLAREKKLCPLEEAVRRVTSKPADMIGLKDRGRLKVGYAADITVFDAEKFAPRATYLSPVALAEGVRHVVIGGGVALRDGVQTDARCGQFLRKAR